MQPVVVRSTTPGGRRATPRRSTNVLLGTAVLAASLAAAASGSALAGGPCDTKTPTILGTPGDDVLTGTPGPDV
ncbi:MAG: hypothetical protein D6760_08570, partial [Deltaproteobacteria bacterium]